MEIVPFARNLTVRYLLQVRLFLSTESNHQLNRTYYGTHTNRSPPSMRRRILERMFADSAFKLMPPLMKASRTPATAQYNAQPRITYRLSKQILLHNSYIQDVIPILHSAG